MQLGRGAGLRAIHSGVRVSGVRGSGLRGPGVIGCGVTGASGAGAVLGVPSGSSVSAVFVAARVCRGLDARPVAGVQIGGVQRRRHQCELRQENGEQHGGSDPWGR